MRKVVPAIIGIVALITTICIIANFGAHSMRRVSEDEYKWRISWADRR